MTGGCPGSAEIRSSSCCFGKAAMAVVMVEEKKSKDMKRLRTTFWNTIEPSIMGLVLSLSLSLSLGKVKELVSIYVFKGIGA